MINSPLVALATSLLAVASPAPGEPAWEEIFNGGGSDGTVTSVWAASPQDWFVGGKWGVARSTKTGIERTPIKGRGILGLFGQTPSSVFAFGYDELVLHFDGKRWLEEHITPQPPTGTRAADLLYSAFYLTRAATAPIVAFGTSLVLV